MNQLHYELGVDEEKGKELQCHIWLSSYKKPHFLRDMDGGGIAKLFCGLDTGKSNDHYCHFALPVYKKQPG